MPNESPPPTANPASAAPASVPSGGQPSKEALDAAISSEASGKSLPPLLLRERTVDFFEQFVGEFLPAGPTEMAIVKDLAHQAAAMELWAEASGAAQRKAAQGLPLLAAELPGSAADFSDMVLAGAVASDLVDRCQRHGLAHSKAFYRALERLERLQSRRSGPVAAATAPPNPFASEAACEAYLRDRFERGENRCSHCGSNKGHYLPTRRVWECSACRRQTGLRAGTVAAASPLPLAVWFAAIGLLLWRPTISTSQLQRELGITRTTTVRNLARKIRAAHSSENTTQLLAGLDTFLTRSWQGLPEPGGRPFKKTAVGPHVTTLADSMPIIPVKPEGYETK